MGDRGQAEHYIYTDGFVTGLVRDFAWAAVPGQTPVERERLLARHAVSAVVDFCESLVEPLEFVVDKRIMDESFGAWINVGPAESAEDVTVRHDVGLDETVMLDLVDTLLAEPCELTGNQWPGWSVLAIHHTRVRLPSEVVPSGADPLVLDDLDNKILGLEVPLRRRPDGAWTDMPFGGTWSPIVLRAVRRTYEECSDNGIHYACIELDIHVNWSIFEDPGAPGVPMVTDGVERLIRRGWRRE